MGSEMCIRDRIRGYNTGGGFPSLSGLYPFLRSISSSKRFFFSNLGQASLRLFVFSTKSLTLFLLFTGSSAVFPLVVIVAWLFGVGHCNAVDLSDCVDYSFTFTFYTFKNCYVT